LLRKQRKILRGYIFGRTMYRLSIVTSAPSAAVWSQFLIKSFKL